MTILAIPIIPFVKAWKILMMTNPVAGIAVGVAAAVGAAIYEGTRKK